MTFVVIGRDVPGGEARRRWRSAHLEFVAGQQHRIVYAGPLLDGGEMVGSVFIFDLEDRKALDSYLAQDPYFSAPIFASVEIWESRRMVPEPEPGFLAAEAARARAG